MDFYVLGGGEIPASVRSRVGEVCETIVYPDEGEIRFISCKGNSLSVDHGPKTVKELGRLAEEFGAVFRWYSQVVTHTGCIGGDEISFHTLRYGQHSGYFLPGYGGFQAATEGRYYSDLTGNKRVSSLPASARFAFENNDGKMVFRSPDILKTFEPLFYGDGVFVAGEDELVFLGSYGGTFLRGRNQEDCFHLSLFQNNDAQIQSMINAIFSEEGEVRELENICIHACGIDYFFQNSEVRLKIAAGQGPSRCFWQLADGSKGAADVGFTDSPVTQQELNEFGGDNGIHKNAKLAMQLLNELPYHIPDLKQNIVSRLVLGYSF